MARVDPLLLLGDSMDFLPSAQGKLSSALEKLQTERALAWHCFEINHGFIIPIPSLQTVANFLSLWICPLVVQIPELPHLPFPHDFNLATLPGEGQ